MDVTRRKMNKIVDELITFLFAAGGTQIHLDLQHCSDRFTLEISGDFDPAHREQIDKLQHILHPSNRYKGLEDFYWELAGNSGEGQDPELQLVAQMVDGAECTIAENSLSIRLYKLI